MEFADFGDGDLDAFDGSDDDVPPREFSSWSLCGIDRAIPPCLQHDDIASLPSKTRRSQDDLDLKHLGDTYATRLKQDFALDSAPAT